MKINHKLMNNNFSNSDIAEVKNFLKNKNIVLTQSKKVEEFEKKWSKWLGVKYSTFVNSGSSALLLAMETLDIPEGSEVITPALTFSTTVGYIVKNKLIPVFVDVEEGTYCINEKKINDLITKKREMIFVLL